MPELEDHIEQVFLIECSRCSAQEPLYRDEMAEAVETATEHGWRVQLPGGSRAHERVLCPPCASSAPRVTLYVAP